jgi:hypothetical protein
VVEDIRIEPLNPGTRVVLTFRWQALQSGKALVTGAVVP